jgi:hypothetical protein
VPPATGTNIEIELLESLKIIYVNKKELRLAPDTAPVLPLMEMETGVC